MILVLSRVKLKVKAKQAKTRLLRTTRYFVTLFFLCWSWPMVWVVEASDGTVQMMIDVP